MIDSFSGKANKADEAYKTNESPNAVKRPMENENTQKKRIKPTLISSTVSKPKKNEVVREDGFNEGAIEHNNNNLNVIEEDEQQPSSTTNETPITECFAKLIEACR